MISPSPPPLQIPWADDYEYETARELFGSNLLVLTWIKGGLLPSGLVDDILRGLGLERETETQEMMSLRSSGSSFYRRGSTADYANSP